MNNNYMECEDSEGNEISMDIAKTIEANKGLLEQMELRKEEINHPEKTVYGRAFIKNFDDQAGYRDSVRFKYLRCPFFIAG